MTLGIRVQIPSLRFDVTEFSVSNFSSPIPLFDHRVHHCLRFDELKKNQLKIRTCDGQVAGFELHCGDCSAIDIPNDFTM
jgi:hypothetical protein